MVTEKLCTPHPVLRQFLFDDSKLGKLEKQLLGAGIAKLHGGFGVVTRAFESYDRTHAKALVLYDHALCQLTAR